MQSQCPHLHEFQRKGHENKCDTIIALLWLTGERADEIRLHQKAWVVLLVSNPYNCVSNELFYASVKFIIFTTDHNNSNTNQNYTISLKYKTRTLSQNKKNEKDSLDELPCQINN